MKLCFATSTASLLRSDIAFYSQVRQAAYAARRAQMRGDLL